ncbi:hypothetical protein FQ085_11590 [Planococcus sp. ANT_H30]|uniref:tail assembly chaperone n=1 Tax=Planococcus sp. ANT_H30 TaxID=2597347 RepID=UPI0011ED6F99|nr:tail assembly chaperone [Planococcus sp. ANT_H30]KAA0956629.1 hypothetical protein FQ085_11590 [Planococcus sp. ANT_H30]
MTILNVNGKGFKGKGSFAFDRLANKKYDEVNANGQKLGGFMNIYMGLLGKSTQSLSMFWDCAVEHHEKDRPSLAAIENALEERIDNGETEQLFKDAFHILDESGFYAQPRRDLWKGLETMKAHGKTAEEKKGNKEMFELLTKNREELKA